MTTQPTTTKEALEPPERIWIDPKDRSFWNDSQDVLGLVEYTRASRNYFCSCGGALTAEEYIEHYFEKGHDRGDPAFWSSAPTAIRDEAISAIDQAIDAMRVTQRLFELSDNHVLMVACRRLTSLDNAAAATPPPSTLAKAAAEEIVDLLKPGHPTRAKRVYCDTVATIIERCLSAGLYTELKQVFISPLTDDERGDMDRALDTGEL